MFEKVDDFLKNKELKLKSIFEEAIANYKDAEQFSMISHNAKYTATPTQLTAINMPLSQTHKNSNYICSGSVKTNRVDFKFNNQKYLKMAHFLNLIVKEKPMLSLIAEGDSDVKQYFKENEADFEKAQNFVLNVISEKIPKKTSAHLKQVFFNFEKDGKDDYVLITMLTPLGINDKFNTIVKTLSENERIFDLGIITAGGANPQNIGFLAAQGVNSGRFELLSSVPPQLTHNDAYKLKKNFFNFLYSNECKDTLNKLYKQIVREQQNAERKRYINYHAMNLIEQFYVAAQSVLCFKKEELQEYYQKDLLNFIFSLCDDDGDSVYDEDVIIQDFLIAIKKALDKNTHVRFIDEQNYTSSSMTDEQLHELVRAIEKNLF